MAMRRTWFEWTIWFKWVFVSVLGAAVGLTIGVIVGLALVKGWRVTSVRAVGDFVGGAIAGTIIGILQWSVLRRHVFQAGWWVPVSVVGLIVGFAVGRLLRCPMVRTLDFGIGFHMPPWSLGASTSYRLGGTMVGALSGVAVGMGQWLVLRRRFLRAGWWILASTVGLMAGFALVSVARRMPKLWSAADAIGFAVGSVLRELLLPGAVIGVVSGAITGVVLLQLLQYPLRSKAISTEGMPPNQY